MKITELKRTCVREPTQHIKYEVSNYVEWKGTSGCGDFMMGLNCCHLIAELTQDTVYMDMHWYHSEDYNFHMEDPETIVERFQYIHRWYKNYEAVKVRHIFNSDDDDLFEARFRGMGRVNKSRGSPPVGLTSWLFKEHIRNVKSDPNKIVIWKPFLNAAPPPNWKLSFDQAKWDLIVEHYLKSKHKFKVVEIDYRTPVREVMYHISTCRAVVGYEGMWHYFSRNLLKPAVFLGKNPGIYSVHDPQAVAILTPDSDNFYSTFKHKDVFLATIDNKLNKYKKLMTPYL
jgi:hypothetical protein